MKCDHIILFWYNNDWGKFGRAYEKMAKALSEHDGVKKLVLIYPPDRNVELQGLFSRFDLKHITDKLFLISPFSTIESKCGGIKGAFHRAFFWIHLRLILWRFGFRENNTLFWVCPPHPFIDRLIEHIPHADVVAQVMDDFSLYDKDFWLYPFAMEQYPRLAHFCSVIFVTSTANFDKFNKIGLCYQFEIGVSSNFLGKPRRQNWKEEGRAPVIGYVGWFSERTDISLLLNIAKNRPDWQLYLIGPQHGEPPPLESSGILDLKNIRYFGEVPNDEIPYLLTQFDVCLIPHLDTGYSRSMSPLKLYQYLASGRPVVSTNIAGLNMVKHLIHVSDADSSFELLIERALVEDTIEMSKQRVDFAREKTWDSRASELLSYIQRIK